MTDTLDNIRITLLYDKIRTLNSALPEPDFQALKAMPTEDWINLWIEAGIGALRSDLGQVHEMLWPTL